MVQATVCVVFKRYLQLMRRIQTTYWWVTTAHVPARGNMNLVAGRPGRLIRTSCRLVCTGVLTWLSFT
jgi:hypothetical protein